MTFVALHIAVSAPVAAQTVERPEWKPGDTWTLRKTVRSPVGASTSEVVRSAGKDASNPRATSPSKHFTPNVNAPSVPREDAEDDQNDEDADENSEMRWLRWPLVAGDRFELEGTNEHVWSGVVDGWFDVSTPAGTFRAIKVSLIRGGKGRRYASETLWYSPDVKYVVRRVSVRPWSLQRSANATTTSEVLAYTIH